MFSSKARRSWRAFFFCAATTPAPTSAPHATAPRQQCAENQIGDNGFPQGARDGRLSPRAMVMWLVIMMQPVSASQSQYQNIPAPS